MIGLTVGRWMQAGDWIFTTPLHFLDDGNELIESLLPTVVESHNLVFLAGLFIAVDYEGSVLRPISVLLKRNDSGRASEFVEHSTIN